MKIKNIICIALLFLIHLNCSSQELKNKRISNDCTLVFNGNVIKFNTSLDVLRKSMRFPQNVIRAVLCDTDFLYAMMYNPSQEQEVLFSNVNASSNLLLFFRTINSNKKLAKIEFILGFHKKKCNKKELSSTFFKYSKNYPVLKLIDPDLLFKKNKQKIIDDCFVYNVSLYNDKESFSISVIVENKI
jgi:hypothetical protein